MSEIYEIGDAVVAALEGATWPDGQSLEPKRVYIPMAELIGLAQAELRVFVVLSADEVGNASRDGSWEHIQINIGVLKKLSPNADPTSSDANDEIDPLLKLCRAIALFYTPGKTAAGATITETKYAPMYDHEKMRTDRLFLAVISLKFLQQP